MRLRHLTGPVSISAALLAASAGCVGRVETPSPAGPSPVDTPSPVPSTPPATSPPPEDPCRGITPTPSPVVTARLTRDEYVRTVEDLFGIDVAAAVIDLPFEVRAPYSTTSVAQSTDLRHAEVYQRVAELVAARVGGVPDAFTSCTRFEPDCELELIGNLGRRVFRRPLREQEVEPFRSIFDLVQSEGDDFEVASRLVLQSMLQSPQFLYHLEDLRGDSVRAIDAHALASRIAYLVWRSGPDELLLASAEAGTLSEAAEIAAQVRRMARDRRATEASLVFLDDWMDLSRLERAVRVLSDSVKADMREETQRFATEVLWTEGGGLIDLLSADFTFATPELAERYGLTPAGDGFRRYDLSAVPSRRGLLTQGSILAAHANGNRPAFVSRGLFMLRSLLCSDVPDPVVGIDTTITDIPETASERDKSQERLNRRACQGCHLTFDPLAYAFHPYDGAGRTIVEDEHGHPVASDGWLPAQPGRNREDPFAVDRPYRDVEELLDLLLAAPFVRACMAEKPLGFAIRRTLAGSDRCAAQQIAEATERTGGSYVDLLVAIATHPLFTHVAPEEGS